MKGNVMKAMSAGAVALLAVLFSGGIASAGEHDDDSHCGSDCWRIEFVWVGANLSIRSLPLSVRDVPTHPDDYVFAHNRGPIDTQYYGMSGTAQFGVTNFRRFLDDHLRLGLTALWMLPFADRAERNYTNAVGTSTLGYGAALTYVTLSLHGVIPPLGEGIPPFLLSVTPKLYMEVPLVIGSVVGVSASYFSVTAENGWDRYSSYETHQERTLGRYIPVSLYLHWEPPRRIRDVPFGLQVGVDYPLELYQTALGKESGLTKNMTYHVAYLLVFR